MINTDTLLKNRNKAKKFIEEVLEYYKPWYNTNDPAHMIDHASDVLHEALKINKALKLGIDEKLVILAAAIHDIRADDRKNHHLLAKKYVETEWKKDKYLKNLLPQERKLIANAVAEHRSSFTGKYSSKLAELISAADTGDLNLDKYIIRTYLYHKEKGDKDLVKAILFHLKDKYGKNGYAKFSPVWKQYYKKDIADIVENLDREQVIKILKRNGIKDIK